MQIRGRDIGPSHPPYVIAEVSCNHAGSEAVAHALIDVAKESEAHAVKFQFYTPDGMVEGEGKFIAEGPWSGETMRSLYARSQMPWEWGPRLKAHCHAEGLAFIASAYDHEGLDWLMRVCVPDALKVASFEATDTPFIRAVCAKGLPVIASAGMTNAIEVVNLFDAIPYDQRCVLHCVSAYPTPATAANLRHLDHLPFSGFSDHTLGHAVACAAVAKGVCVLEKHIQLHPALSTADSHFSLTPDEFTAYCSAVYDAWRACQPPLGDAESASRQFRRGPGGKRGSYAR